MDFCYQTRCSVYTLNCGVEMSPAGSACSCFKGEGRLFVCTTKICAEQIITRRISWLGHASDKQVQLRCTWPRPEYQRTQGPPYQTKAKSLLANVGGYCKNARSLLFRDDTSQGLRTVGLIIVARSSDIPRKLRFSRRTRNNPVHTTALLAKVPVRKDGVHLSSTASLFSLIAV